MRWWFSRSFKTFSLPYPIYVLTFYLLLWYYLQFLKMFTETLLRTPFSVISRCSVVPTSHWLSVQENAQLLVYLPYSLSWSFFSPCGTVVLFPYIKTPRSTKMTRHSGADALKKSIWSTKEYTTWPSHHILLLLLTTNGCQTTARNRSAMCNVQCTMYSNFFSIC